MKIDIESVENGIASVGRIHFLEQAFLAIVVPDHRQCMLSKLREPAVESIVVSSSRRASSPPHRGHGVSMVTS